MNRRGFLKRVIAVPLAVKAVNIAEPLDVSRLNSVDYIYSNGTVVKFIGADLVPNPDLQAFQIFFINEDDF